MSRREHPDHQRRRRILAGLMYGAAHESTYERASKAATSYLRGQQIRVTQGELDFVANSALRDLLFPPCECPPGSIPEEEREAPGPHHGVQCPSWRAVRL